MVPIKANIQQLDISAPAPLVTKGFQVYSKTTAPKNKFNVKKAGLSPEEIAMRDAKE